MMGWITVSDIFRHFDLARFQTWNARAPIGTITVGNYGYIPGDSTDFAHFVCLRNSQEGEDHSRAMNVVGNTHGTMLVRTSSSSGFPQRQPASPFPIPDEKVCLPIALPPRETQWYLYIRRWGSIPSMMPGSSSSHAAHHSHPCTALTHKISF